METGGTTALWGHMVGQSLEELCYKLESCRFNSQSGQWIFQLTLTFQLHYGPGVDSASNGNEYQESS
jgi:hypothetical protein